MNPCTENVLKYIPPPPSPQEGCGTPPPEGCGNPYDTNLYPTTNHYLILCLCVIFLSSLMKFVFFFSGRIWCCVDVCGIWSTKHWRPCHAGWLLDGRHHQKHSHTITCQHSSNIKHSPTIKYNICHPTWTLAVIYPHVLNSHPLCICQCIYWKLETLWPSSCTLIIV